MGIFDNFEVYAKPKKLRCTIAPYGITFSDGVADFIEENEFVHFMFDEKRKKIALIADDNRKCCVPKKERTKSKDIRYCNKALIKLIYSMGDFGYYSSFKGEKILNAIVFDLKKARKK